MRQLISGRTPITRAVVQQREAITHRVRRIVLAVAEPSALEFGPYTDHYVRLLFPRPGTDPFGACRPPTGPDSLDLDLLRERLPRESRPVQRTYTVRDWNGTTGELTIDVVLHGDHGVAGPWAAGCQPGDTVHLVGPGGGYHPDPGADWHLFAGDTSSLPAIAVALDRLPRTGTALVFLAVAGMAERQPLPSAASTEIVWVPDGRPAALLDAVRRTPVPAGRPDAFVHGEAQAVALLRRYLRVDLELPRERLSCSGYWRRGADEDSWRTAKAAWNRRLDKAEAHARTAVRL